MERCCTGGSSDGVEALPFLTIPFFPGPGFLTIAVGVTTVLGLFFLPDMCQNNKGVTVEKKVFFFGLPYTGRVGKGGGEVFAPRFLNFSIE